MNQYPSPFNTFWQHATKVHKRSSDNKHECYKEYQKHEREWLKDNEGKTQEDFSQYLINMIDIEQRHRAAMHSAGQRVDPRKAWVRWLRNYQYREEFEESIGELNERAKPTIHVCCVEGCEETWSLVYRPFNGYYCEVHDLEYNDPDYLYKMRHTWKKIVEKCPKMKGEDYREHHRRYIKMVGKERSFADLPYRKNQRLSEDQEYDERELLEGRRTVEADPDKEQEYRERYGVK